MTSSKQYPLCDPGYHTSIPVRVMQSCEPVSGSSIQNTDQTHNKSMVQKNQTADNELRSVNQTFKESNNPVKYYLQYSGQEIFEGSEGETLDLKMELIQDQEYITGIRTNTIVARASITISNTSVCLYAIELFDIPGMDSKLKEELNFEKGIVVIFFGIFSKISENLEFSCLSQSQDDILRSNGFLNYANSKVIVGEIVHFSDLGLKKRASKEMKEWIHAVTNKPIPISVPKIHSFVFDHITHYIDRINGLLGKAVVAESNLEVRCIKEVKSDEYNSNTYPDEEFTLELVYSGLLR